jgi:hypothetical protein
MQAATKEYVDASRGGGLTVVANIAALRAATVSTITGTTVFVQNYRGTSGGPGAIYQLGAAGTDDGGMVIADSSARFWRLETFGGPVSALHYGAVGDDSTDNTTALQNWLNSGHHLHLPQGIYRTRALTMTNKQNLLITGTTGDAGLGPALSTAGSYLRLTQASVFLLTLTTCTRVTIRDIRLDTTGAPQSLSQSGGIKLITCFSTMLRDLGLRGFAFGGIHDDCPAASSQWSDGTVIDSCEIVFGGNVQVLMRNTQDWIIRDSAVGCSLGSGTTPVYRCSYGIQLENANGGWVINNAIWGNDLGLTVEPDSATWISDLRLIGNRFELSWTNGLEVNQTVRAVIIGNWFNTNNQSNTNADQALFTSLQDSVVIGNTGADWSGGSTPHRYGWYFTSTCTNNVVHGNHDTGGAGVTNFDWYYNAIENVLSSGVTYQNAIDMPNGANITVTALTIPSGVWDISGVAAVNSTGGTLSRISATISGGNLTGGPGTGSGAQLITNVYCSPGYNPSYSIGPCIGTFSGPTYVTLQVYAEYSGSGWGAYGYIQATRIS